MDYIVEEASGGSDAGVFLAKKSLKDNHFAMGLSPISFKLHLLLGEKHISDIISISDLSHYLIF